MKRSGFTMIELIFVIVILGILAAVAIPKLAATRDDAKISKGATEVAQIVSDFGAYYTANGAFSSSVATMTNVKTVLDTPAGFSYDNGASGTSLEDCVDFNVSTTDGNLTVSDAGGTSSVCKGIVAALTKSNMVGVTHTFGGTNITY